MRNVYLDTETMGICDPLLSIQYKVTYPIVWQVWFKPVEETLELIEWLMKQRLFIWNASFDIFQLNKWYNIFKEAQKQYGDGIPNPRDINECIEAEDPPRIYCIKPRKIVDLLLICKKGPLQHLMNQKPYIFRRVPNQYVDDLINTVINIIKTPFGIHWHVIRSKSEKAGYTDIQLISKGGFKLKDVIPIIRGEKDILTKSKDVFRHTKIAPKWKPWGGQWWDKIYPMNKRQIKYASDDTDYLEEVHNWLSKEHIVEQDTDSVIAAMNGANYWKGFAIDPQECKKTFEKIKDCYKIPTSPSAVQRYLGIVGSTAADVLQKMNTPKANEVIKARKNQKKIKVLEYLVKAGGLFVNMKSVGTLSNRQAGGHEETKYKAAPGSINLQGQDRTMRDVYTLAYDDELLSGGDFSGFEVSIVDALLNDPQLHKDLVSGYKLHGLWASTVYEISYEEVLREHEEGIRDASGKTKYERAKNSVFANFYGAQPPKQARTLNVPIEDIIDKLKKWHTKYVKIGEFEASIKKDYTLVTDRFKFKTSKRYVESFFGFRRYFTVEIAIAEAIQKLLSDLPWEDIGEFQRFQKRQNLKNCMRSILFGLLFTIQGRIRRVAGNHKIQSPGGEITKKLQERIWGIQPYGCHPWKVRLVNVHDELQCCHIPEVFEMIAAIVRNFIEEMKERVPLIKMDWKINTETWSH